MPALSTGVDLIEIERFQGVIERHGQRFLQRVFTQRELEQVGSNTASLAARFAAKEAVSKALGTGIGAVAWGEIEILRGETHAPELILHGKADQLAQERRLTRWSISLSHAQDYAIAVVVACGTPD